MKGSVLYTMVLENVKLFLMEVTVPKAEAATLGDADDMSPSVGCCVVDENLCGWKSLCHM